MSELANNEPISYLNLISKFHFLFIFMRLIFADSENLASKLETSI